MSVIKKARNQGQNVTVVQMPIYEGNIASADWDDVPKGKITNQVVSVSGAKGVRSLIKNVTVSDIQGVRVGMMVKEGSTVYRDIVTIIGQTQNDIIVKFDDDPVEYSIRRSQVRLVLGVE